MKLGTWIVPLAAAASLATLAACGEDSNPVDACEGVVCDAPPASTCDGDVAVTYPATGTCNESGTCEYEEARTDCTLNDMVCINGACDVEPDPCAGVVCDDAPDPTCDGTVAKTYAETGTCEAGNCSYAETTVECADTDQICVAGECVDADCTADEDCVAPANYCDGEVAHYFISTGTCTEAFVCDYTAAEETTDCAAQGERCESGGCVALSTADQLDAVKASLDQSGVTLPVAGAVVTFIKPDVTGDAGFFVQAGPTGPAVLVQVDPATLTPTPVVGDVVSFEANAVAKYPPAYVTAISNFTVTGSDTDLTGWEQDVNNVADLVSNRADYDSELLTFSATLVSDTFFGGGGYLSADVETAGITGNEDLEIRIPEALQAELDLQAGCAMTVAQGVMWGYSDRAQLSPFYLSDIEVSGCPAPLVAAAHAADANTVVVEFTRNVDAGSVEIDGTQFTIEGLAVTGAAVDGKTVTLATDTHAAGTTYTVVVDGTVTDTYGTAVGAENSADFLGFGEVPNLIFTEYVEGGGFNKALELTNIGTSTVDLAACEIRLYGNGSATPTSTQSLAGDTLPAGSQFVVCHGSIVDASACDLTSGTINHNGDDGYAIACNGVILDSFGQIGTDPGAGWTGGDLSTVDRTLRRKCTVTAGDTVVDDAFDPSVEWDGFDKDVLDGLGHRSECAAP